MRTITICTVLSASVLAMAVSPGAITCLGARHEGPDPALISADAAWLMHLDLEHARATRLGRLLFDAGSARMQYDTAGVQSEFGVDPVREIRSVTAYGLGAEGGPGVVIIDATAGIDRIIEELSARHGEVITTLLEGYEVMQWDQGVASIRAAGEKDRMVVIGPEAETLLLALRVIDDVLPSLADNENPVFNQSLRPGAFFSIQIPDTEILTKVLDGAGQGAPEMLRLMQAAALQLGEHAGVAYLDAAFGVGSDKDAQDISDVAQGLVAMGRLMLREEPDFAKLDPLLRAITVRAEGPRVRLLFEVPADQLPDSRPANDSPQTGANEDAGDERDVDPDES